MKTIFEKIGELTLRYPALQVGALIAGTAIAAVEHSYIPAAIQGACAVAIACQVKRWF